ncbi:hypothetical protein ESCO_004672 [Escovopsis weberi]|uniref:Uncharacterized protein n=1 Tax=Escovopsis weberi TaxID=150374 RepID=A0A0M9VRR0_ESCWE|nr:hypothetical protein ESCO_004672 [Escovopsis weberi]
MGRRAPRDDDEDADPTLVAYQAQKRILQLKRERDESVQAAVAEANALMEDLKSRVEAHVRDQQSQRASQQAQRVAQIMDLVEKRQDMELRMGEAVRRMHGQMSELADLMAVAYEGRLRDARSARSRPT